MKNTKTLILIVTHLMCWAMGRVGIYTWGDISVDKFSYNLYSEEIHVLFKSDRNPILSALTDHSNFMEIDHQPTAAHFAIFPRRITNEIKPVLNIFIETKNGRSYYLPIIYALQEEPTQNIPKEDMAFIRAKLLRIEEKSSVGTKAPRIGTKKIDYNDFYNEHTRRLRFIEHPFPKFDNLTVDRAMVLGGTSYLSIESPAMGNDVYIWADPKDSIYGLPAFVHQSGGKLKIRAQRKGFIQVIARSGKSVRAAELHVPDRPKVKSSPKNPKLIKKNHKCYFHFLIKNGQFAYQYHWLVRKIEKGQNDDEQNDDVAWQSKTDLLDFVSEHDSNTKSSRAIEFKSSGLYQLKVDLTLDGSVIASSDIQSIRVN